MSLHEHPLDLGERNVAGRGPDEVDDRAVGLFVDAGLDGAVDDVDHVVRMWRMTLRRLLGEQVDPGVRLREQVSDTPRDGDRLFGMADALVAVLQHLDL